VVPCVDGCVVLAVPPPELPPEPVEPPPELLPPPLAEPEDVQPDDAEVLGAHVEPLLRAATAAA